MYIAPNSTIELFRGLKLDNSYSNTMWFSDVLNQNAFFTTNKFTTYNNVSYQRKDIGVIRLEGSISALASVNYMRYKNTAFENKWFYAFVNRVEYVNNVTCNLYYTIDVIQTYMFDWTLEPCLIERQHSTTDVAGDNLIPEGLTLGDYINATAGELWVKDASQDEYSYLICAGLSQSDYDYIDNQGWADSSAYFQMVAYQFTAIAYFKCDQGGTGSPIDIIDYLNANNLIDSIVSIVYIPKSFSLSGTTHSTSVSVTRPSTINGHTPVNKKLLTYPYCYLDVYNDQNEHEELRFELFGNNCTFNIYDVISATPEAVLYPLNYNGITKSPETGLSVNGFPQIPYYNDAYKAWQALNYDQMAVSRQITAQQVEFTKQGIGISQKQLELDTVVGGANAVIGTASALSRFNVAGAASSAIQGMALGQSYEYGSQKNELASTKAEYENYALKLRQSADESRARNLPNSPHAGSGSCAVATDTKGFWYNIKTIRKQFAERIDKYFTMFGYAQNVVATPNIHARTYFTYIKTVGSCVSGLIPQDDRETIDTIFDRGIRFWTDYSKFEDYTVSNTIPR